MGAGMIDGVLVQPLNKIETDAGDLLPMMRNDADYFQGFGEIYFSTMKGGTIKAWRMHSRMQQNFVVPTGQVRLVIFDDREGSRTKGAISEYILSREDYFLVRIPVELWYGFQNLSGSESLIANMSSIPHDANEIFRLPVEAKEIPYEWRGV